MGQNSDSGSSTTSISHKPIKTNKYPEYGANDLSDAPSNIEIDSESTEIGPNQYNGSEQQFGQLHDIDPT